MKNNHLFWQIPLEWLIFLCYVSLAECSKVVHNPWWSFSSPIPEVIPLSIHGLTNLMAEIHGGVILSTWGPILQVINCWLLQLHLTSKIPVAWLMLAPQASRIWNFWLDFQTVRTFHWVVATQKLGKMNPFWRAYFSKGLGKNHQLVHWWICKDALHFFLALRFAWKAKIFQIGWPDWWIVDISCRHFCWGYLNSLKSLSLSNLSTSLPTNLWTCHKWRFPS